MTATPFDLAAMAVAEQAAAQNLHELGELAHYLAGRPLTTVVEIGVFKGGTFWLWNEMGAVNLLGIDIGIQCAGCNERRAHDGCPWPRIIKTGGTLLERDSQAASTVAFVRDIAGPIDFLHIDGDHSREAVERDWSLYSPLVRKGGTVALHDTVAYEGVREFWHEELAGRPGAFEIYDSPAGNFGGGYGYGIVPV